MGYKLTKVGNSPNIPYEEWICDSLNEFNSTIANKRAPAGSICYIMGVGIKIMSVEDGWKDFISTGGSEITVEDALELLEEAGLLEGSESAYTMIEIDGQLRPVILLDENNSILTI